MIHNVACSMRGHCRIGCLKTHYYGQMAAVSDDVFGDQDLAEMYCPDNGRPSLPPAFMSGVTLLQLHDDVSDREAVERTMFDQRWKVGLGLPLDFAGFDPSSLSNFRKRLVEHGMERYAFDRFIAAGRAAGLIPDKVTLLTDTTWAKGAGAVQNTYTLIRKSMRKVLRSLGYATPGKRRGLSAQVQTLVATYVDKNRKAEIDWADPEQRAAQLKALVRDAEAVLDLAAEHSEDAELQASAWLLTKILGDDIVDDKGGDPQIGEGTAPDRIISITDPDMRHGRKSRAHRFDGFKVSVSSDLTSDMILDIADVTAAGGDGQHLLPTVRRTEAQTGVTVERVVGDGAYGSGENLEACAQRTDQAIDLLTPVADRPIPRYTSGPSTATRRPRQRPVRRASRSRDEIGTIDEDVPSCCSAFPGNAVRPALCLSAVCAARRMGGR